MSAPTETEVKREAERVAKFEAWLRAKGVSDNDRAELHRFASMLSEEGRADSKAVLDVDASMSKVTMRPRELDS